MLLTERQLKHKEKRYKYLLCYQQEEIFFDSEYAEYAVQAYLNKHDCKNIMSQREWARIWSVLCTSICKSFIYKSLYKENYLFFSWWFKVFIKSLSFFQNLKTTYMQHWINEYLIYIRFFWSILDLFIFTISKVMILLIAYVTCYVEQILVIMWQSV